MFLYLFQKDEISTSCSYYLRINTDKRYSKIYTVRDISPKKVIPIIIQFQLPVIILTLLFF